MNGPIDYKKMVGELLGNFVHPTAGGIDMAQYLAMQGFSPEVIKRIIEASQLQGRGTPQQYGRRDALTPIGPGYPSGQRR